MWLFFGNIFVKSCASALCHDFRQGQNCVRTFDLTWHLLLVRNRWWRLFLLIYFFAFPCSCIFLFRYLCQKIVTCLSSMGSSFLFLIKHELMKTLPLDFVFDCLFYEIIALFFGFVEWQISSHIDLFYQLNLSLIKGFSFCLLATQRLLDFVFELAFVL